MVRPSTEGVVVMFIGLAPGADHGLREETAERARQEAHEHELPEAEDVGHNLDGDREDRAERSGQHRGESDRTDHSKSSVRSARDAAMSRAIRTLSAPQQTNSKSPIRSSELSAKPARTCPFATSSDTISSWASESANTTRWPSSSSTNSRA